MSELIARNIAVKAGVVSADEREEAPSAVGGRALLNLGHTFAHAIETLPGLEIASNGNDVLAPRHTSESQAHSSFMLHHGEAVGLGLIAAASASAKVGLITSADAETVSAAVGRADLPTRVRGLPHDDALIERMSHDKKNLGGTIRLILLKALGEAVVVENPPMDAVRAGWAAIRG
jgi:3-dehydroquinate synthetase